MKNTIFLIRIFVFISGIVSAELVRGINIDFVNIGHPMNDGDPQLASDGQGGTKTSGYGSVAWGQPHYPKQDRKTVKSL